MSAADVQALTAATASIPGAEVHWLLSGEELEECGALLGSTDRLLLLTEQWNRSLMKEIRWTPEECTATRDGIGLDTLELSSFDKVGLQLCRHWSALKIVRSINGGQRLERMSRKALASASAVGLVTMPNCAAREYFLGGRAVQRLWLTAARCKLALHPMTTLPYLLTRLQEHGTNNLDKETQATLRNLQVRFSQLFASADGAANVFLFRLSHTDETQHRSLRRNLDAVLTINVPRRA
jgi:hypothetical protein